MMTARGIAGFILLLIVAAASWYLSRSLDKGGDEIVSTSGVRSGFYLRGARILGTGADGQFLYEIDADFAEQVANNLIELQNVRIKYTSQVNIPWKLVADTATITGKEGFLLLEGHVVATSGDDFTGSITEFRTQYLKLDPGGYRAETDSRVQVQIGSRSLTATGMLALLNDNQLTLKSNVNGMFVP